MFWEQKLPLHSPSRLQMEKQMWPRSPLFLSTCSLLHLVQEIMTVLRLLEIWLLVKPGIALYVSDCYKRLIFREHLLSQLLTGNICSIAQEYLCNKCHPRPRMEGHCSWINFWPFSNANLFMISSSLCQTCHLKLLHIFLNTLSKRRGFRILTTSN